MNIGSSGYVTFNPFDPDQQLPADLTFQGFWSSNSQELSNELIDQNQIPAKCFPDRFFTDDSSKNDLSFLGVHLTSRISGVKIQVGVFNSLQKLAVMFQYEGIALRDPNNVFRYSYSVSNQETVEENPKTFHYTQSNINTESTCQKPGIYVYEVAGKPTPWTPPLNPFVKFDIDFFGGKSQRNKPETISIGENSMTVSFPTN